MAPKDENELRQMLLLALKMDKPVAISIHGASYRWGFNDRETDRPEKQKL